MLFSIAARRQLSNFLFLCLLVSAWAAPIEAATITLRWNDLSTNETGFRIERMPTGGSYSLLATVGSNVTSYTDTSTVAGKSFCYRVSAYNSKGTSAPSNAACTQVSSSSASSSSSSAATVTVTSGSANTVLTTPPSTNGATVSQISGKWRNYKLSLSMRPQNSGDSGVMFRYLDSDNYYRLVWDADSKVFRLEVRADGLLKVLATRSGNLSPSKFHTIDVEANDATIKASANGTALFSITNSTLDQGQVAMYTSSSPNSAFDNILVRDLQTGNVLLQDSFDSTGIKGWTIIDEAANGSSSWSISNGALIQKSAIGSTNGGDSFGTFVLYTKGGWTDYKLSLTMKSTDNDTIGVMFRFADDRNYYGFSWNQESSYRRLRKTVNGSNSTLAQDKVPYVIGRNYQLMIIAQGTKLQVLIDGQLVFSVNDSSLSAGTVALYNSANSGSNFDNVKVEDLSSKSILLWDDFNDGDLEGWTILDNDAAGKSGPSVWSVKGGILVQSSNIGSGGTIAVY